MAREAIILFCSVSSYSSNVSTLERRPVKTGETITVECDEVLVAVGVDPNPLVPQSIEGLKEGWAHAIEVNEDGQSNISDIYAGGDIARGAATVVLAMGDGRRAANKMAEELLAK